MYSIFAGETCIYDGQSPLSEVKVINPKLSMADNSAGSLTFTMQSQNAGYDIIERLATEITVKKDGEEIWSGRIINEEKDFFNQRKVTCEGELAYLNDTTQPMHEYHIDSNTAVAEFLQALLNNHNSKATSDMQFQLGAVTVTDPNGYLYRYTNYESTLECIKEKLLDKLGGHLRVRKENGIRKLDYLADYYDVSGQTIEFGKNLIDFTSSWDLTELATVVLPLGNQLEESSIEALQEYLTIKEADTLDEDGITHEKDSIYVKSDDAISTYGWIETVVRWDDVSVANNLMTKAKNYLMDAQFEKMVLELSAVDLHNLNPSIEALKLLHKVECISPPHGMDRMFPVTKMDIPLDKPEETIYTLGASERMSMSTKVREGTKELMDKIEDSSYSMLTKAKKNAAEILNARTRGYITIDEDETNEYSQELLISDTKDSKKATKLWVWNMGGLGHFPNGRYNADGTPKLPNVAITMDGAIVADFITTGTMSADRVRTGLIQDEKKYNYWNLSTGELVMNAGHAKVGNSPVASEDKAGTIASDKATAALNQYDTSLNQSKVFAKLTNNGAIKGIYMQDGQLYINASYLKSGAIDASIIDVTNLNADNITSGSISTDRLETGSITDLGNGVTFKKPISSEGLSINGNVYIGDSGNSMSIRSGTLTLRSGTINVDIGGGKVKEGDSRYVEGVGSFSHGLLVSSSNIF